MSREEAMDTRLDIKLSSKLKESFSKRVGRMNVSETIREFMRDTVKSKVKKKGKSIISVELSSYAWHKLLNELTESMRVINRDRSTAIELYEMLSEQLNDGHKIEVKISKEEEDG